MRKVAYKEMFENEMTHAWYVATRNLMIQNLKKYLKSNAKILDAGCGTGGTMIYLKNAGFKNTVGIDRSREAIQYAKKRGFKNVSLASINKLPFDKESFDAIVCLDVLYHQNVDYKKALREFWRVLKKEGTLYLQEPAYDRLRGSHDFIIQTKHRFTKPEINNLIKKQGFKSLKSTYFNMLFFIPVAIKRMIENLLNIENSSSDVGKLPQTVNYLMTLALNFEGKIVGLTNLPFGLSVILVAQK